MEKRYFVSVFFISIATLAVEMGSIRFVSVINSSSFAAMIISIALLGYGLSATLLTIYKDKIEPVLDEWLFWSASAFIILSAYVFILGEQVPFVPQSLHQDKKQLFYLGLYYVIFFLPFFTGSLFINLTFLKMKKRIGTLYFFNMFGSGIGSISILFIMFFLSPQYLMLPVICFGALALFFQIKKYKWMRQTIFTGIVLVAALLPYFFGISLKVSQYKDISYAMKAPNASIIKTVSSPLGYIQIVRSEQFHFAPGLSLSSYNVDVPNEDGIFIDGISASGIVRNFKGKDVEYITYLPFSLPFSMKKRPEVLILGMDGGNPILFAEKLGASKVTAVEPNRPLVSLIHKDFKQYTSELWNENNLSIRISNGRSFCKRNKGKYDIILIPAMVSSGMSFSSGTGHGENYLFTTEAISEYISRLEKDGILYISMKMESPPRTLLKLEALSFTYLKKMHPDDFSRRIIFIRGLDWGSVMIKNGIFSNHDIELMKKKVNDLSADFSYFPGIKSQDTNINNQINNELYYKLAESYLGNSEKLFLNSYFFNINPPSDNKPYFNQYLRFSTFVNLFGLNGGLDNIPYSEWGYLLLWATLFQGIIFSLLIISFPLLFSRRRLSKEKGKYRVVLYFSVLGMGFMFIEIAVIQKLTLFLANPLYSVAFVISALLIFSGLGSQFSGRYTDRPLKGITVGVSGVIGSLLLHVFLFTPLLGTLIGFPEIIRIVIALIFLAPLGFFMGFSFPLGLQVISNRKEKFLPWALSINGSVSVFATVATSILSMQLGFIAIFLIAAGLYLVAYFSFPGRNTSKVS